MNKIMVLKVFVTKNKKIYENEKKRSELFEN